MVALLEEYEGRLGTALAEYDTHRQRFWVATAVAACGIIALLLGIASEPVSEQNIPYVRYLSLGIATVLVLGVAFGRVEFDRRAEARKVMTAIAIRLDPVVDLAIAIHERGAWDEFHRQILNLKLTEARLRIEQVERRVGRSRLHISPALQPRLSSEA